MTRPLAILTLLLALPLYHCGGDASSGPRQLDLIHFDLSEETFSNDYQLLTFEHRDLQIHKIVEIYRDDLGIYSPIDRKGLSIEPGRMVIVDPERYWRISKIQCPSLKLIVAVLP